MHRLDSEVSMSRILVEVGKVDHKAGEMAVVIPGWAEKKVTVSLLRVEPKLLGQIHKGGFLLVRVNFAAKTPGQLLMHGFEPVFPPVSERELVHFPSS